MIYQSYLCIKLILMNNNYILEKQIEKTTVWIQIFFVITFKSDDLVADSKKFHEIMICLILELPEL